VIGELRPGDPLSVGPYRLLARLGAGGMGQVFLARSPGGRLVAVKVIRPELAQERGFRARFAREITAAQSVSGMYTAPVVDSDAQAELPWMATAYVPGPSLADAVEDDGPLPVNTVAALAAGLAEALAGIHRSGVVHRDLKPSNVLIAADGPRVIDFGISLAIERSMLSAVGTVLGSPGFMSPEQARGQRDVGKPTDVFSLGAVLVFAATGIGPFGDGPIPVLIYRVVNERPDLAEVPGRLRPLIERCLAKDPVSRPSPAEVLEILADRNGAPTGEWLPQTVVDRIGRFSPVTEAPMRSPFIPEPPERGGRQTGSSSDSEERKRGGRTGSAPDVQANTGAGATKGQGSGLDRLAANGGRWHKWRWPVSVLATVIIVVAVVATILVTSRDRTPPPSAAPYISEPLATGSSQVMARVYFGQLKAVISALAGQVTFNTPAAFVDQEPSQCSLTVVFSGVTNPTGAVYASGLDSGWPGLEYAPSETTVKGRLHEQIVTPGGKLSAGKSWLVSAELVAGSQRLTSDEYSLKFKGGAGATQTWLIDGQAVSCHG